MAEQLRYSDYYHQMSLADFMVFAAQVTAGLAVASAYDISMTTERQP